MDDMYRNVNRRNLTDHGGGPPNPERTPLNGDMPATPTAARLARAYDEQLRRRKRLLDRMTKALRQHGPKLGGGWDEVEDLKHVNELLENATEFIESAI